jgi:choline dehydrogenase-like flavoprotein
LISEQAPNPDSWVRLSRERDRFGLNCVQLDWRLSPLDRYTLERSQQLIAEALECSGLGQLHSQLADNPAAWQSLTGSYHHMGTTRMSTNPRQGVVNEHCQVHGVHNLFIAGSSVFPTSGLANPTLTIVALAIRLADHLKECLQGSVRIPEEPNQQDYAPSLTSPHAGARLINE